MNYTDESARLFLTGCNCAESVFTAFAGRYGIDRAQALKMSIGLGGGVGRMRQVCGAVSAAAMILGLEYGSGEEGGRDKLFVYEKVQCFCERFQKEYPSLVCSELLKTAEKGGAPEERTEAYYAVRPCPGIIEATSRILHEMLNETNETR